MRRIPELDALRGVAAVAIIVFHLRFNRRFPALGTAVDLFFVLSGYLITTILLRSAQSEGFFRLFYIRRALRIWPIYYLVFPVYFLLINPLLPKPHRMDGLPFYLTYTQFVPAYWGGETPPFSQNFLHTWTLAVEEQFYLFWPVLVWFAGRRFLPLLIAPLWIAPVVLRSRGVFGHLLLTRCDGLALGALLAWLLIDAGQVLRRQKLYQTGFAAAMIAGFSYPFWASWIIEPVKARHPELTWHMVEHSLNLARFAVAYFGLVGLVVLNAGHRRLAALRWPWLVFLGQISYGLYLYHPMVFTVVALDHTSLGMRGSLLFDLLKLPACFVAAWLSWRLIEEPILRLKDRFCYKKPTIPAPHLKPERHPIIVDPAGRESVAG